MQQYRLQPSDDGAPLTKVLGDVPIPGHGEVRIKVQAASLNYRDLVLADMAKKGGQRNVVALSDGAGQIDAVGPGVTKWREGDSVVASFFRDWIGGPFKATYLASALGGPIDGVLAERIVLPEQSLVGLAQGMTIEQAASLPCAAVTAWQAIVARGRLVRGQTMLIQGTGGVALFGLQIGKALGARVIVLSSSDRKLGLVEALGADAVINYVARPDWDQAVLEMTDGNGADFILELGGPQTYARSLQAVAAGGRIAQIGVLTGFNPSPGLGRLQSMNADIVGITVGSVAHFEAMNDFFAQNAIKPVIDRVFEFDEAAAAFGYLRKADHVGKVVIKVCPQ